MNLRLVVAIAFALLAGCVAREERPATPVAPQGQRSPPPTLPSAPPPTPPATVQQPSRENRLSAATRSLVSQARALQGRGNFDGASATLDRALRIEPHNPLLWIERGRLRMAEQDAHQAESCGRKALALAGGDPHAQAQAGRLLADALRLQGRNPEATAVERQAFMR